MSAKSKLRYVLRNTAVPFIGWERWNAWQHRALHGYWPNFRRPTTFLEYLQHCKYYGLARELAPLVDKHAVKSYVAERVGTDYVIPTLSLISNPRSINYASLPERWIAKSAHAAGWNYTHNGGPLDQYRFEAKVRKWLSRNYWSVTGEDNYRYIPPKIMFEPLITGVDEDIFDFKVWCFAGKAHFIGVHGDRKRCAKGAIFKLDWTPAAWTYPEIPDWTGRSFQKPTDLGRLLNVAEQLSAPFPFVRVDLYEVKGKILFGELTFTPGDGTNIRIPYEEDLAYGSLIRNARGPARIEVRGSAPAGELLWRE